MRLPIYQLDAFTDRAFGGNPAAVCLLDDWLDDATLQAIALENNLSETAFLVAGDNGDYELRWFTPTLEIDLCGHATLASAWLILHRLTPDRAEVGFATRSGRLTVRRSDSGLRMDFPADPPASIRMPHGLEAVLGVMPEAVLMGRYCMAVLATEAEVRAMAPDLDGIGELTAGHLIVTAKGAQVDFVSRFFAPGSGIAEDPVTGSAHCILAPYWAKRLGKRSLTARQVSARGGELRCTLDGDRVGLTGSCTFYMEGWIEIPDGGCPSPRQAAD
ncbi:MAG: PhzF family phenazine biosynthesis protein [Chloroflexi bacterium]|nr:PhzF family phenazine biosynthesis protein [Chloroflexota bacterium]MCY3856916.1 PhzF family phenazine biosynthesis protein [Rhodospirillales bacterium]MCY4098642.1 PhzF family phenazine biosynthesis protein [Rhodospirillales bacterium]MYE19061.1 PhzF family phenazine biosynthesis protein [Rhodospirillales bacterium]